MPGLDPTNPPPDFTELLLERSFPGAEALPLTGATAVDLAVVRVSWAIHVVRDELAAETPDVAAADAAADAANTALAALNNAVAAAFD